MIIDHYYEAIIAKLTAQQKIQKMSNDLRSMTKNYERVLFIANILNEQESFPKLIVVPKCEALSTQYRNQGNQSYRAQNHFEAWQFYNLAIMYAPQDSQNYYLAISNRSAVFYELKKIDECLKDIQLVFKFDIPNDLRERLNKRQAMGQTALLKITSPRKIDHEIDDKLNFIGEKHSVYTCASSKLEVKYNKDMGRHVIAKEDLKVGDVLVDEEPYVQLLLKSQFLFSCSYCLSRSLNLLPCDSCCFSMYCSDECKIKAFKEYHEIECPLMATLMEMEFTKLELIALRTVIKSRTDHDDWNSLFLTIEEAEALKGTDFHGQVKVNDKWVYDSKYYTSIHTLESNIDKRLISDIFQKGLTGAVFLKFLTDHTKFLIASKNENDIKIKQCVADSLLLHLMTVPTNMHGLSTSMENKRGQFIEEVSLASAAYAFHSLINHSCAPNVLRVNTLGTTTLKLMCIRPIKKGMQLFDNYGLHHGMEDLPSRIKALKFQYKFVCKCEACVNNWPTYLSMGPTTMLPQNLKRLKEKVLSHNSIFLLEKGDKKTANKIYDDLCRLCETLEPYAPCKELCDCQEALKQCIVIYEGLISFGYSQTVTWKAVPK